MNYPQAASYEAKKGEVKKALLLFSGGLDSSVMVRWIREEYGCKVATLTVNLGQIRTAEEVERIRKKALHLGAVDAVVHDAVEEFAYGYVGKSIMANGRYRGKYYLSTPLGRPLLARIAAELAPRLGCDCVAHGCTGKGNDQVRLDGGILACNPSLKIMAPVRTWNMGRSEELRYAEEHGIEVPVTRDSLYSHDENLWGMTSEGAEIESPEKAPDFDRVLTWCRTPEKAASTAETLTLGFQKGIPVSLNGAELRLPELVGRLNKIAGKCGVGVGVVIEDRILGMKSRGVYEAPAAEVIISAHEDLEKLVLTHDQLQFKAGIDRQWAWMCYHARWFDPLMDDLSAYLASVNRNIN
ncbi:MAG: argininosuccinate synthase, partial [Planctomycetota bacterium]|nr:argininosuccinate synthase [Planctomycetota bacterium]